jgi:hypothetical protein
MRATILRGGAFPGSARFSMTSRPPFGTLPAMPQTPIPNFHNARLSLIQSFVREVICKKLTNTPGSGLFADHPVMRAAGATLVRIEQGALPDTAAAFGFYDAESAARRLDGGAAAFPVGDCLDLLVKYAIAWF